MEKKTCFECTFYGPTEKCQQCNSWSEFQQVQNKHEDDVVKQPSHYTRFKIEPITFVMENDLPFHTGNIIKYACRAGHKLYEGRNSVESEIIDLEKVRRYAEMRISLLQGRGALGNGPEKSRCL